MDIKTATTEAKRRYTLSPKGGYWFICYTHNQEKKEELGPFTLEGARSWRKFLTAWEAINLYTGKTREEFEKDGHFLNLKGDVDIILERFFLNS